MNSTRIIRPTDSSKSFVPILARESLDTLHNDHETTLLPLENLLVSGGDARIVCGSNGMNKYGCFAVPKQDILSYGSCTASTISSAGFAAAAQLYWRLENAAHIEPTSITYAREMNRIRGEIIALCGLTSLSGLDIIFGASGTDLHMFSAQLFSAIDAPLRVIMAEASETGSGVPAALGGQHFSDCTSLGGKVIQGEKLLGISLVEVSAIKIRLDNGDLRPASAIDSEVEALTVGAVTKGQRVLLILTDLSKTGLTIPSVGCAMALKQRFSDKVDILVDACQFRLSRASIHAYLEQDCMLAMTGSKFVTGPAFSAALLVPQNIAKRLRDRVLPATLNLYSAKGDWPEAWAMQSTLTDTANYGLLLRFEAALAELRAFHGLSETDIKIFLETFADVIQKRLNDDPAFEALSTRAIDRTTLVDQATWDQLPTIFPFMVRNSKSGMLLSKDEMKKLYEHMTVERYQLGQPVACGALRLCLDMRLIVDALSPEGRGSNSVIAGAMQVLDKAAELASIF